MKIEPKRISARCDEFRAAELDVALSITAFRHTVRLSFAVGSRNYYYEMPLTQFVECLIKGTKDL